MASLPRFEHDIFFSYAHLDNECLFDSEDGWIDLLHQRLEVRLAQLLGEQPRIWRDPKLAGNDVFGETLIVRLSGAALILSIISPRYLKSEWCLREVNEFYQRAPESGGLQLADKSRIFKIIKTPVERNKLPDYLDELLGYEFYEFEQGSTRFREFAHDVGKERDKRYWNKLEDLAQDIKYMIELVRAEAGAPAASAAPAAPAPGKTVYLAETSFALTEDRDRIRRELLQHGHRVLPDKPLSLTGKLRDEVNQYLAESALAVHLIGADYGIIPEGEARSVTELQHALAAEQSRAAALTQLIWLPQGLASTDPRQSLFIEELLNHTNLGKNTELLQTKLEDLKTIIQAKLNPPPPPAVATPPPAVNTDGAPATVYLVCDQADYEAVAPIESCLYDNGLEVLSSVGDLDAQTHKEYLRMCDAVLTYGGKTSDNWLGLKKTDLIGLPALKREKPLLAKAFYLSLPQTTLKDHLRIQGGLVIKNYGDFSPDQLAPFLQQIARAKGAQT